MHDFFKTQSLFIRWFGIAVIVVQTSLAIMFSENPIFVSLSGIGIFSIIYQGMVWALENGYLRFLYARQDLVGTWQIFVYENDVVRRSGICWIEVRSGQLITWGETYEPSDESECKKKINYWRADWVVLKHPTLRYWYQFVNHRDDDQSSMKMGFTDMQISGNTRNPQVLEGYYFDFVPEKSCGRIVLRKLSSKIT